MWKFERNSFKINLLVYLSDIIKNDNKKLKFFKKILTNISKLYKYNPIK